MLKGLYCLFLEVSGEVLVERLEEGLGSLVVPDFFDGVITSVTSVVSFQMLKRNLEWGGLKVQTLKEMAIDDQTRRSRRVWVSCSETL